MNKLFSVFVTVLLLSSAPVSAGVYKIDPDHSHIGFSVKHLVISNVKGRFNTVSGAFNLDNKDNIRSANLEISAASIKTENEKRDRHLRSGDFLDVSLHPKIVFNFKKILSRTGNKYKVLGDITIRGVTKEIHLDGELLGKVIDPWGNSRVGFTGTGKLDRTEFGLVWNNLLEAGGVVVGEEVKLLLEFEGILQK